MRKIFLTLLTSTLLLSVTCTLTKTASAASVNIITEYDTNGCYWETIIKDVPSETGIMPVATDKTTTKTKTSSYKSANSTVLWSVSVTATFSYNGTNSKCLDCSDNAVSYNSAWTIKSSSSSKNSNCATAVATATYKSGTSSKDYTRLVTISCDKNGKVS